MAVQRRSPWLDGLWFLLYFLCFVLFLSSKQMHILVETSQYQYGILRKDLECYT